MNNLRNLKDEEELSQHYSTSRTSLQREKRVYP